MSYWKAHGNPEPIPNEVRVRSPAFLSYCRLLFEPFFKWWWAAITGVASILSYLALPESGVVVSKLGVAASVLVGLFLVFLVLSVV